MAHPRESELDEQTRRLLASAPDRPSAHLLPVATAREHVEREAAALGPGAAVASVVDARVGPERIPVRVYRPGPGTRPAVVYLHGGGWVLGSIDTHDALCRALANASGCVVLSVGYRRAPEHPFPAAVDDAYAALAWVAAEADGLGVDPARITVGGDSAGGNLAIAAALLARDRGGPAIAAQLLVYPITTTDLDRGIDPDYEGLALVRDELRWHQRAYLPTTADAASPLASPLDAADLRGLPPTLVVTAQCDPVRPQGELYAAALRDAGVAVRQIPGPGMVHGFFQLPHVLDRAAEIVQRVGAVLGGRATGAAER